MLAQGTLIRKKIATVIAAEFALSGSVQEECRCSTRGRVHARVRYSTALPHLLLFIIFLILHVYYICYFLLSMYGHQGNAGTLSHVISVKLLKTVISFYIQSCLRTKSCIRQMAFIPMFRTLSFKDSMTLFIHCKNTLIPGCGISGYDWTGTCLLRQFTNLPCFLLSSFTFFTVIGGLTEDSGYFLL